MGFRAYGKNTYIGANSSVIGPKFLPSPLRSQGTKLHTRKKLHMRVQNLSPWYKVFTQV
jgi:hypothetical protein